jgi:hypothetical protein
MWLFWESRHEGSKCNDSKTIKGITEPEPLLPKFWLVYYRKRARMKVNSRRYNKEHVIFSKLCICRGLGLIKHKILSFHNFNSTVQRCLQTTTVPGIPRLLGNSKFRYRTQHSTPVDHILSHFNLFHALLIHLFYLNVKSIFPFSPLSQVIPSRQVSN